MAPKKMLIVASVTTKLCSRVVTTISPLTAPSAAPMSSPSRSAANSSGPASCNAQPITIAEQTLIAPSARLRPPVTITVIIARPMTPSIAMLRLSE